MKSPLSIKVKITGLPVDKINLRRKIENGNLTNLWELVAELPGLGTIPLDDDVQLEIYDSEPPKVERVWVWMSVGALKRDLLDGKYVKKRLPSSSEEGKNAT